MSVFSHLLCLSLLLGLLQPPGVCLCDLAELLAHQPQACDDSAGSESHDHDDENCPCAKLPSLASARGGDVAKPADAMSFTVPPFDINPAGATTVGATILDKHHPPSRPLYLMLRALRN